VGDPDGADGLIPGIDTDPTALDFLLARALGVLFEEEDGISGSVALGRPEARQAASTRTDG